MTASKLEESIQQLADKLFGRNNKELSECLRSFAEAVRENSTCRICMLRDDWVRENLCAEHKRDAEPKECERCANNYMTCPCECECHKPDALPDEVKEKMNLFIQRNWDKHYPLPMDFSVGLQELLRLCLSLRKP